MNIKDKLKIKKTFSESDIEAIKIIENSQNIKFANPTIADKYISEVLNLFHKAFSVDKINFIDSIFFEFYLCVNKISFNKQRIYFELKNLKNFNPNSVEEATHLVNIYRNIVSDLFDPYISVIVACLQFTESKFTTFVNSNLGQGERNKYEFCLSRMNNTILFNGYDPIVRNAISHAGTDSILIENDGVVFRNIKRGNPPVVTAIKWHRDQLNEKILELLDFIHSIDLAVEIFGLDSSELIKSNEVLNRKFLDEIIDIENRLELQKSFDLIIKKINDSDIGLPEKLDALTAIYFIEIKKRKLDVTRNSFNTSNNVVMIEIPVGGYNISHDDEILSRFLEMLRYGILAEPCFRNWAKTIAIIEVDKDNKEFCKIVGDANLFREYNFEEAGIVDLANDLKYYFTKNVAEINVDFNKVQNWDFENLGRMFPRKKR